MPKRKPKSRKSPERAPERASRRAKKEAEQVCVDTIHEELVAQSEHLMGAQAQLDESRDRYTTLYDCAPMPYFTLDLNGIVETLNIAAAFLLGMPREAVVGRPLLVFVDPEDRPLFLDHMMRCRRGRKTPVTTDFRIKSFNSARSSAHVQLISIASTREIGGGHIYLSAMADLTRLIKLQEEREQAEEARHQMQLQEQAAKFASDAKDRFLAALSHELRTPLTPILAAVSSAEIDRLPEPLRGTMQMIRRNIELEARLIDDLLDVTRIMRNKLTLRRVAVDLHKIIEETAQMLADNFEQGKIRLVTELSAERHWVWGDALRLRQVIWNLLSNATKFTPEGGRITVCTTNRPLRAGGDVALPPTENGEFRAADAALVVTVSDTGSGIDPALLPRLFKPFEQGEPATIGEGRRSGLGLGLSICKGLIDAHSGVINARSDGRGTGSTFTIDLAAILAPADAAPAPAPREPAAARNLRILLVEDHADTAKVMSRLLKLNGHTVKVADSVAEAREIDVDGFDVLISDLGLPDGTGLDVIRHVHRSRAIPAIALSGYGSEKDVAQSIEAGFSIHLTKPIDFDRLLVVLRELGAGEMVERH